MYISYSIPVVCLLIKGRESVPHGPFWLGKIGLFANIMLLLWTTFTVVMFSFPVSMPVTANNMNYVSVVYAVVAIIVSTDWLVRGRKSYRGQSKRHEEVDTILSEPRRNSSDPARNDVVVTKTG